jgi:hypothetical protein
VSYWLNERRQMGQCSWLGVILGLGWLRDKNNESRGWDFEFKL